MTGMKRKSRYKDTADSSLWYVNMCDWNKKNVMFIIKFPRHQSKLLSKIANANYSGAYVTTYIDIELLYLNKI